jgi:DNA-binding MarR family transcriptional regulator
MMPAQITYETFASQIRSNWPEASESMYSVFPLIHRIQSQVSDDLVGIMSDCGLEKRDFFILETLRRCGAPYHLRIQDVGRQAWVSPIQPENILGQLVEQGLVACQDYPPDNDSMVCLTDSGKCLVEATMLRLQLRQRHLISGLSKGENGQLEGLLQKLLISIDAKLDQDNADLLLSESSSESLANRSRVLPSGRS